MAIQLQHANEPTAEASWSYAAAYQRNRGLINAAEQEKLRNSRVP